MTSTNDGKDVKSNQTSGHKSKSYYIELYTSLEKALSGDSSLEERTAHVCEAWRRVYSLYQHSAASTHPHLLSWLQRHTANTVLQSKWAKSKNEQARLTNAIDALVAEATAAAAGREQHPWERLLLQRAAWFRKAVENPWDNPVLKSLINPNSEPVTDQQVLEWLISEHGIVLVTRLRCMVGAGNCDDLALLLASAVMDRVRAAVPHRADDGADDRVEEEDTSSFVVVLEREASFTADEWEMLTDMELVLLLKTGKRSRCIELAKLTPLRHGYKMVERLRKRLEISPRDKKLWKHAKEVATLVAQVVIARCMVLWSCSGAARDALYWCARALARLTAGGALRAVSTALAAPAATARHLHTFCAALSAECKELKTDVIMKPFICELYVRAITAGMNELEQLKLNSERASEARTYEQTLAGWFTQLGGRLTDSSRLRAECALTAFSVHPARKHYERVASTPQPPRLHKAQEPTPETISDYGSWANDSRTQSNLVKTSETLQLKQSQQHQANVLSTAILTEGEALGLEPELCQDLAVLLSGPRVKTLSWDMDREGLLENCRAYMEKTHGGTRAVTTELKFLNLDPDAYRHLPEEGDDEGDLFYGIEKGYEHEVQLEEPEDIWQNAFFDPEHTESANDSEVDRQSKKKTKTPSSEDDEDPLSNIAEAKKEKKKLAKEKRKERRKKSHTESENKDGSRERRKDKDKKTKKERKKDKSEQPTTGSLTSLLGMKVTKMSAQVQDGEKRVRKKKERRREPTTMFSYVSVTDSDYDSQGKSSQVSEHDPNVLVDGVFSMDELRSPGKPVEGQKPVDNTNTLKNNATVQSPVINEIKTRPMSSPILSKASGSSGVSKAKSSCLTPNHLGPRHVVNSKVKSSIAKLLQFRRNKSQVRDIPRPPPSHTPTTPTTSLVGMKIYNPKEVPKVCLSKKQSKQLEAISKEVNDLFNEARSSTVTATPELSNKLRNQSFNNVQKQQQQNSSPPQNYNESQKHSKYTQHSPIRPDQQVLIQSPSSVIHSNYTSPIKMPEHMRTHALNLSPPKPTITYQPFHKSMQNLSTDTKYDPPKKPQLINDPNYFSQQHAKSNSSQLSPRIISNTCIKPPSQTPTNVQQYYATVKDNITKSPQTYSNLHGVYTPRGPEQSNNQITISKNDVKHGQKQLGSSMQNISDVPGSFDATKCHIPTPNMQHGQADKQYSVISQRGASNTSPALHNNNTTASRCLPVQRREKVDKTPEKPNIKDNFDEYLKELVRSINASSGHDKNVTVALNKEVKVTSVPPSAVPAKRVDSVTPQCAKQLIQQKKPDNAPNTFSRRSYMHKNKQSGNKVNITDAVTFEINRTIMDRKISKAKFTQHEVTISRVGPNTQGAANVKRKLDQPCSRLQRDCPVLSGILDSSEKNKIHTVTNTTTGYTSGNQPNREDADLLLLLRNQAILKPNVSNVEVLTSDASSGQASNNSQVKVDSQNFTTHQGLVGTKVRSINMPDNTLENEKSLDWKCVMDAIIAQKTEPLGPKALDLALKKEYRRPQSSSRAHSSDKDRLSGQSSSHNKPLEPKKREYQSSKASSSRKSSTEKHSAIPKPREFEIVKKVCNEVLNRPEVSNKHFSLIPKDLPQTPVIPNSDYDVLDDLIDDDLRRELGEISSDEDTYSAPPNAALLKGKTYTNIPKTFTNIPKAANICKEKPHIVNPKIILPKNETNVNIVDSNRRFPVNTCSITGYPNVINNSSHPTSIENKAIAKPETARQHIATSTIITNQVAQDTANNIVTRCKQANPFMTNVIPANMIIASAPQPAVVVIRQDFYDPYPLIRIHENQVNAGLCTLNQNMYTLNATPNIAVYQTTQYAAPVINPVIIGNATTTTNVSNATAMSNDHDTPDCRKDVSKQDQDCISLEDAIRLTDNRNQMPELPTNLDLNMNRNCERKVLSLVQEKHTNENVEKDSHLKKLPVDDGPFKTDEDRIKLKRQSLMNRKISHAGYHPPIPLTYTPLSKKNNLEKQLQQEMPKNGFVKPNLKSVPNSISDNEKCVVISTSVTSPQSVANNENIESTDQASSAKENQKSCRRIWLRSSNKIRNKVSPVKRLRVSLKRNKIKLKVNHNVTGKFINAESENKDNVKTPTRISNRLLNKTKLNEHAANNPASEETTQQNLAVISELIDFEEALSSSIVLKTLATNLGTDNTSKQESECKLADKKVENIKPDATVVEQHQNLNSIEDTKVASQSNRLEPTVVIEKLKSKLGDQLTIKSSLVKTSMKKPKVLKIKNSNRAVLRNKRFKCIAALDATSNKIIIKASPKNITSAAVGSSVPDNANKFKSVVILDQKVIKAAPIGTPLVRVETNKLVEQKVNEHTLAVGLPIPHDGDYKPKQALDDGQKQTETSKLNVPVANQRNTKRITAANLQPASGTSKVNPTAKDDVEVNDKVPAAVDDQKDIERTTASELQVIEDNTNIINSTLVDNRDVVKQTSAVELPALEFDLNESNKSEPKALDGQRAITPTGSTSCPNRSVSNTVGKKQGNNDSTDCNKASSALEAKNNQSRTFKTTTESLDSQKSFRATRTKSDTPTGSTPCPNQSVSTTVQKKQGNDSTDCNQALSELEAKNNQLQTTTMTESLESQKTFRATRTKSDTPTGSTPCPNQSVSSTVQKKQGNDSTDYNQASSELEEKNNQLQTTTMTESLESQKTFRATRTKSDTPTGSIPCPNQSVSTTVQKKQGNDSADCNQASSELEAKNNQSRELTTMTESLDSPKNLRAMKTKSDTVINKANTLVQPNKSLILLNHENPPKPNALSSKVNKTCFKPTVKLSPTSDNVNINHVPVIQKTNEEVTHITETGVVQSTTEILKTNSNDGDTNKDRQIVTGKSLCRGNIGEVLNVGQEKKNVQPNLNHHLPPNLTDVPNKDKQTSIKGDIKIEELPVEDNKEPHKKLVRITLPNGKVFRATIHGKMQGDFNSLFSDPTMRSILAGSLNDGKRYTVNYKQICKTNKENPNKILGTQIQNLNIKETKPRAVPIDTVNLISDDEDEVPTLLTCGFTTEFGKYTANVDKETFTMHQKKFNEKCEVKMYRDDIFKSNKTKPKRDVQSEKSSLLTRHKSKLLTNTNAPVVLNTPTNIIPEVVAHTDSLLLTRHKSKLLTNTNAPVVVNTPTNVIPEVVAHTDSSLLTRHKSKLLTNTNAPVVVNTPTNIIPEVVAHTDSSLLTRHKSKLLTNTNAPVVVNTPTNIIPEVVAHTDSSLLTRHKSKLITNTNAPVVLNTPTNIIPEVDAHTDSSLLTRHNSKLLTNTNAPVVLNTPTNIIPEVVAHTDSSLLTRHKSKLLTNTNAPVVVNTPTNIIPEVVAHTDISTRAQETPIATLKQADSTPKVNTANVIEIDDSSNDSIENPTPEIVDDIVEPVKKIVELKSLLLHDLGVGMDKNIGFPLPKQKSVNNLKNALLQDLGIVTTEDPVIDITADEENEDGIATDSQKEKERLQKDHVDHTTQNEDNKHITSIQTQNYQCFGHNPADDNIQSDERHKEMITKCQERNTLKKCVVRLVKCDNLIKKYERMKIMKKCYVKIERLNNSILNVSSPSLNENTNNQVTDHIEDANNEETNEINPENVEDFIEFDAEEPSGSPQLSRFPSLSILNNWDDDSQPLEIPYPTSPVMEIYDNMVELRNKQKTELFRDPEKLLSMICDSEWTVTKFGYRIEEILLRSSDIPASENKIVPDCDTLMVSGIEKHGILFDAPRLLTLTLKFLEDNPVVLYRLESMRSLRRISATKTAPNKLKRKTEEFVNDSVASKILKLGTLALNSLNSCINVIDGITFPDIEENMKIQSDASCINIESNNRILEFQPNDIATPVQDIEYDKQIYDSLRTLDIENSYPEKTRTDLIAECEENLCTRRTIEVTPINENINSYLEDTIVNADCNESMVYNKTEAVYKEERQGNHSSQPENIEGSSRILIEFQPIDMNRTLQNIEHDKPIDNSMRTLDIKNSYPEKSRIDMIAEYENNIRSRRIIELTSVNENTNSYLEDTIVTIDSSESTGDNKTEAVYKEGTRGTHNSQPQNIEGSIGVLIESQPRDMNITLQNIEYDKPMSTLNIENSEQEKSHTDLVAECEDNVYSNRTIEVAPVNKESKSNLEERILIAASLENIVGNKTEAVYNEETTTHSSSPENNKTKLNALCDKECRSPTLTVTHVHEETLLIADSDTSSPDIEAEEKSNEETQDYITKPEEIKTGGEEDCASPNGNVVSHVHEETLLIANFDISSPAVQAEEESKEETQDYITKPEEIKTGLQAESENYEECASPNGNVVSHVHEETLLIANFDISSPAVQAEEESKEETQDYITKPEEIKTGLQAESENYEECASPNGNVVSHFHEETLFIADSDTSSPGVQAEEQSKEETQDYITKPEDMKTGLQEQSENYAVCASPNVNASLVNKKTNRNAEDSVAIVDSNTSPTGDIIDENDKGLPQDSNFSDPDKAILDQYAQHINNKECLPPTISDPLINEHNNTYVSDSHKSPPDNKTEEKYTEETNDSGSPIEDIAKEPEPALRESDLATEECKVDASTPVYSCVSVEKPGSCRPSESYICDKNVTEVDSPFSNSIETGGNESQINATIERDEHASTEILHIDNSDRLDEITFDDNDLYEVVVDTHIDAGIGVVETLYEKSREPITVNVDSSGVGHQNCVVKFPIFIDSKKIAFNYHDYTKQPKKEEVVVTSASNYREECEVNNVKDLLTQGCASETGGIIVHKVKSKEEPCCEDKLSNSDVNTNESVPLKSNPECKYELIQEDDLLTVKIITENDKDENEARTACVGSNDSEEEKVVSPGSVDAGDDIDITGFEFEDMYVFPLNQSASNSNNTSNDSLGSELNSESGNCNTQIDLHNIDFHVIEPEITYSRKRKMGMRDIRVPAKKYRKGKNIDCSKQTTISIAELAYAKEYRRLLEYCSSVKFSYMRPFHKECIEVDDLMSNWPINNVCCDVPSDDADDHLFVDLRDTNCHQPPDPMTQTFVEEINYEYDTTDATPENPSSEATEVNFNMGFGEGSGRVIQILKKRESNISAATLSDVKQSQPVLKSVDLDDCNDVTRNKDDQIKKIRQHVNFIELRDKVRTFFKKSSVELKSDWLQNTKDSDFVSKCDDMFSSDEFPFDLCSLDYVLPLPTNAIVQVVQVGQLPVSAAAQNPVTCDPRVTQVSDASPSQCSVDNSPNDDSQSEIKTEYTELTTADLTLPLQEYAQQNQANLASNDSNLELTEQTISLEMEIKAEESPQIKVEMPDIKEEKSNSSDADLHSLTNTTPENMDYSFENNAAKSDATSVAYDSSEQNGSETFSQQRQQNGTAEKTDQIAHAMNAAGITTTPETVTSTRAHALVNILSQKIRQGSVNTTQTTTNTYSKTTSINAMALQQALAQILPPPLNQTGSSENNQAQSTPVGPQVLHIVQGKNASGNQITLVDNSQQSVISTPNATQVLHIVQNKNATSGQASNGTLTPQANSFSGLSLVDAGLQQGGNQLLHIVNTGNQKTASPGQLLKRVNLLTNLTNVQGSNEQKMVQFVCKSADGKAIQLNAPHQRSMVLRLQPIETPNVQAPPAKQAESQEPSPSPTGPASGKESANQQEIKSRSIYEENYAKFIQSSSSKTPGLEKSTSLPKFNQAFGKPVFQEGQKQGETANNNSHLPPVNSNTETAECSATDNAINLEHIGQISSPPLLLRKQPVVTSASQPNIVQQIKQTIAPMNIQTMHGGVIYTRQIPVNIGGGQTINLITVPSTELINDDSTKTQVQTNQGEIEPSIIKIVPQSQTTTNNESSQEESNNHASGSNENAQTTQPQPVLTQMRIKLPMLSKAPQMVPGARVVRPSFFQIQRNVIGGANQPVYQQLVLTAAPPLGQQTIRLPQAQTSRPAKAPSESQSSSESQMSTSTLEQLREFDMVLEQVKERSTVQPSINTNNSSFKIHTSSSDTTDGNASSNCSTESTPQVLYSIGNNQSLNVAYINRKTSVTTPTTSTYVRSPDSSGIADSPTSSTHVQISHTVTTDSSPTEMSSQSKPKVGSKSKSRPKSTSNPPNTLKLNTVPPKTSSQKPLEDEQTTQRILYILAEYKEQVENSPDKDKPAPRRRSNPPSNPGSSKRKKSSSSRRSGTRDMSPVHGEDTCRTMGSEDSSCGTSQGDCTESCLDSHSPQDSPRKVARKITFDQDITVTQPRPQPQRNVIVADGQTITVARGATGKPATAVLMPANYILPVSMVKGGQQIAIVTNRGPKLLTVGGEGGATNALLLQRLIGPAGLKPVLARPGVRHVRLPTAALHNLQAFNLATATTVQPPDSTASPSPGPTPPELVDTRANSSPWTDRDEVKPERGSSPEGSEPWNLPSSADVHEYTYEETVRTDMDRTVLVVQKKDGSQRQHRLSHVSAAALRHKYAILEHELRLQKSLSEECEDLGVDSPSASELFPEAELLFAASPAHEHNQEHHSHTPQPHQSSIPQPDMDDQIATDHLIPREIDVGLGLGDVGIVAVSDDGSATIALDQEEFARSHPNTTFHSEPTDGEVQPFTIAGLKGRHITSTIFHSSAPATVLMTAPQASVISQAPDHSVKYEIENMIHSMPSSHNNDINLSSVLVKDDGLTRFDNILTDSRELHLTNTTSAIVHSSGNATQVIRRVCYEDDKRERDARYLIEEPDNLIAGDDAKMIAEDSSRDATMESMADVDDEGSSPERHAELFWESNSASERSEGRRPLDFSSDSDKCCKSPSFDETNSTDSSGVGAQMRLDTVIKEARGRGRGRGRGRSRSRSRSRSRDGSSAEEAPPLRTYPAKRSVSGKTRAGEREREPDAGVRRRASGRGVVKRGCPCCAPADPPPHAPPAPQPRKRPRMRKPTLDFHAPN